MRVGAASCALCIDACDRVMRDIGRPRGLIDYATLEDCGREAAGGHARPAWKALLRPRTLAYLGIWSAIGGGLLFALGTRNHVDISVSPDRNPPFMLMSDGSVRNSYTLKLRNMTSAPREMEIALEGLPEGRFWTDSMAKRDAARQRTLTVPADATQTVRAYVAVSAGTAQQDFAFVLRTMDERRESDTSSTRFSAPEEGS